MPAAAVIPAPIAYIKVVAVKKLVVGSRQSTGGSIFVGTAHLTVFLTEVSGCSLPSVLQRCQVYFEKIRVLKAGFTRLNIRAWNNGIGSRFYFVGFRKLT